MKTIENNNQLSEYAYWDNADKPEEINEEEWGEREVVCDKILGELGIPSCAGLTYDFINDEFIFKLIDKIKEG